MTATTQIDTTLTSGEYQPLAPVAAEGQAIHAPLSAEGKEAREEAREEVRALLAQAGFRLYEGRTWWSATCQARVVGNEATMGVEIFHSPTLALYHNHRLDGTYDALPLAEKHRLSGFDGPVERWLEEFDRCGQPRPQDGCR